MPSIEGAFIERRGSMKRRQLKRATQHCSYVGKVPEQVSGVMQNENGKAAGDMASTQGEIAPLSWNYRVVATRTPEIYWHTEHLQN